MCRFVQLAVVRLLANPSVLGADALTVCEGFQIVTALLEDERVALVREPDGLEAALPGFLDAPWPAGKLVADAYLAAFAECSRRRLVTFDRALAKRAGVEALQRK
jgi:predicted nucleic acid-binding protein